MLIESKRDAALNIALSLYNTPYVWGGNAPLKDEGVDCSGMVRFILDDLKIIPKGADYASWQFAEMYPKVEAPREGVLAFWLRGPKIGHVEMIVGKMDGEWWSIGASGGGSQTDTIEEAKESDARVKMHPLPANWVRLVDPFLAGEV